VGRIKVGRLKVGRLKVDHLSHIKVCQLKVGFLQEGRIKLGHLRRIKVGHLRVGIIFLPSQLFFSFILLVSSGFFQFNSGSLLLPPELRNMSCK